jgi:hypothetical protein
LTFSSVVRILLAFAAETFLSHVVFLKIVTAFDWYCYGMLIHIVSQVLGEENRSDLPGGTGSPLVTLSLAASSSCAVRVALSAGGSEATGAFRPSFCLWSGPSTRSRQSAKVPLNERDMEVAENDDEFGAEHGFLCGLQHRVIGVRMRSIERSQAMG